MKAHAMSNHLVLAALAVVVLAAQPARASLWTGAANDNNWDNLSNWDSNPSGGVGEVDTLTAYPILTGANTIVPNDLKIAAANPSSTGRVDIRSGTFTINYWGFVGDWGGNATLNLADTTTSGGIYTGFGTGSGSFTNTANGNGNFMVGLYNSTGVVNMNTSGSLDVTELRLSPNGQSGSATFNLDNGSVNVAGSFTVGSDFWGANTNSPAYLNMSGGTITTGYEFWIGGSGQGTGTMTGGTINSGTYFVVGRNSGSVGVFNLSGGTVDGATTDGFTVMGSFAGSSGTLNVSGSAVLNSPREMRIGEKGTGTLNQTGGTVSVGGVTYVGYGESDTSTQSGTLTVSGGTFTSEGDIELGHAGSSTAQASLTIKNGGVVNVASTITRWMIIGRGGSACNSTLTVNNGGTLNLNAGTDLRVSEGGGSGTNVINVDGGTIQGSVGTFLKGGNSTSTITIQNGGGILGVTDGHDSWDGKTIVKSGGVLETKYVAGGSGTAGSGLYIDGGTVRATAAETGFINYWGGISEAYISAGGATIDNAGYDVTITGNDNGLLADPGSAGGGVTFTGTGTTTLAQANTYTGRTDVDAGTLAPTGSGSIANSAVIDVAKDATLDVSALSGWAVGSGQKLEGNGTVDANDGTTMDTVTVNGTLAPGNSIGTLIIDGNLELAGTAEFEIDPDPNPVLADLADVTGLLTYGGTLNVSTLAGSSGAYAWGDTFNLFDFTSYSGTFTGGVSLPPLSGGLVWDQTKLYSEGLITVVPEPATTLGLALLLSGALLRRSRKAES